MLITVLDANGNPQTITVNGQGPTNDFSGTLDSSGIATIVADANRSGCLFQNTSEGNMTINDDGLATDPNAFLVGAGASWPPANYPAPVGSISIGGAQGATYIYRQW